MKRQFRFGLSILLAVTMIFLSMTWAFADDSVILPGDPDDIIEDTGGGSGQAPGSEPPLEWTINPSISNVFMTSVCARNGLAGSAGAPGGSGTSGAVSIGESVNYIATAPCGFIWSSPDGRTWTNRTSGVSDWLYASTYSNGTFVAVGGNLIITSTPGLEGWLKELVTGSNTIDMSTTAILTSTDGKTWTRQAVSTNRPLLGITRGNGIYVAVGLSGLVLTSPDAKTWTNHAINTGKGIFGVAYGDNTYVAVGGGGLIYSSSDAKVWTARASGTTNTLYGVVYEEGLFVAAGENGTIVTSTDGKTWTLRTSDVTNDLKSVTYGNGSFMIVGTAGNILISPGGIHWELQNTNTDKDLSSAAFYNGRFLAVGEKGIVIQSSSPEPQVTQTPSPTATPMPSPSPDSPNPGTPTGTTASGTTPSAAENQTLTAVPGDGFVLLRWKEATDKTSLDGYYLYRGTASGEMDSDPVNDFPETGLSFKDQNVLNGTTYYYIVKPSYNSGKTMGSASNEVSAVPDAGLKADLGTMILVIGNPNMTVNGKTVEIDPGKGTKPEIVKGKTCVPIRAIVENMGGTLTWDSKDQGLTITLGDKKLELWIDKSTAKVNGNTVKLQLAPFVSRSGRTMVPLRFVIENLGCDVEWNTQKQMITINYLYDKQDIINQHLDEIKDKPRINLP